MMISLVVVTDDADCVVPDNILHPVRRDLSFINVVNTIIVYCPTISIDLFQYHQNRSVKRLNFTFAM